MSMVVYDKVNHGSYMGDDSIVRRFTSPNFTMALLRVHMEKLFNVIPRANHHVRVRVRLMVRTCHPLD